MADQDTERETLLKGNEGMAEMGEMAEMHRLSPVDDDDVAKVLQDIESNLIKDLEASTAEKDDGVQTDCETKAESLQGDVTKDDSSVASKEETATATAQKILKEIDTFLDEVSEEETWEDIEMLNLDTEKEKKKEMEYDEISGEEEVKNEKASQVVSAASIPTEQNDQILQKDYLLEDVSSNSEQLTESSDIETKEKEADLSLISSETDLLEEVVEEKPEPMVVSEEPTEPKESVEIEHPKDDEKEPIESSKNPEENEKTPIHLEEASTAIVKSPENKEEELIPTTSPTPTPSSIKIIEDIELPDKAPLESIQNEENIEKETCESLETPSVSLNDETSQGSLVIDETAIEEANESLEETNKENAIIPDIPETKDSETINTEDLESSKNNVEEPPTTESVESTEAEKPDEEGSKTKKTETDSSQPKSPTVEKCRSQLTDGEIISLDSSDEEEPKTVEEVCKVPIKSENEQESKATPMEVDDDSHKEATPQEASPKPDKETQQNDIPPEPQKDDIKESLLEKSSSEMKSMVDSENENYEIFLNKECINCECPKTHKQYYRSTQFTLSYYNITKKKKLQYVCTDCYMKALDMFEELCGLLIAQQPILISSIHAGKPEFVEILDSSDEEESATPNQNQESAVLSSDCLDLIQKELENTIKSTLIKIDIQNQLTWSKTILSNRLKNLESETKKIEEDLKNLQTKADKMHDSLYRTESIKISNLPPLDLNTGRTYIPTEEPLKPFGEITRPPIEMNGTYYAVKNKPLASWVPCRVVEKVEMLSGTLKGVPQYKVKFIGSQYHTLKTLPVKHLAYFDPPPVRLQIGTRVIAYFDATTLTKGKEKCAVQSAFYPGIIAEPLKHNNRFRYLIFYDDGYTQYVHPNDVRLVCQQSEKVWDDVHPGSRDFIENYVTQYNVNRPMVQTHKGQSMNTESNGTWIYARVVDIDCSLVKMHFEQGKGHTEWIYRGSLRLGPVFREYHKMQKESNQSRLRRTEPFIRYTADDEMGPTMQSQRPIPPLAPIQPTQPPESQQRAVARKTTSRAESVTQIQATNISSSGPMSNVASAAANAATIKHLNNETIYLEDENIPKGKVVYYTAKRNLPPRRYRKHECNKSCLFAIQHNLNVYSPLSKPLLSGWERMIYRQKVKKSVVYRAPCGKMLRDMLEVRNYLRATENVLNVDNFDFRPETCCLAEYVIDKAIITKRDITNGLEKMPLPLVNYYDNTLPDCTYAAQRIPKDDVHINTDPEFLVGCDCEDDCLDKSKCSCWQLTLEGAKYGNPNMSNDEVGYQYKRLMDPVPTGIYECNARCKCKSNCLNRVVQYPLQMKLQVFKTNNRGWGLRCINDIPKGSFICIYAGNLLTNSHANEGGLDAGDEYFAELDLIETAEQYKEGYESDVAIPEADDDDDSYHEEEDDDFRPSRSYIQRSKKERSTRTSHQGSGNDESKERRMINFNPNADLDESKRKPSIRQFYGNDDGECYVMDAKTIGNLGRYFNHSCSPNLFVQSVFVDTHDLRFPWVAFFALLNIRAGTELTWNYNYEVGVVPGKVLYCECGAPNCRQRLL